MTDQSHTDYPNSWLNWESEQKTALWEYLSEYVTDNRKAHFERVLAKRTRHLTIAIEDVFQERNAGALLRTCDCFGVQEAHIIEDHHNFQVAKSISKGAQKWVDTHLYREQENNTLACIDTLRSRGYRIIGATPHEHDTLVEDFDLTQPAALFFGAEKRGLSPTLLEQADGFVKIGMHGFTESFNVSVAAAIILHELTGRLHQSDLNWQFNEAERLEKRIEWALKSVSKPIPLYKNFCATHS